MGKGEAAATAEEGGRAQATDTIIGNLTNCIFLIHPFRLIPADELMVPQGTMGLP
jgi:hypothetical protein